MKGLSEGGPGWGLDWREIRRPQGRKISWEAAAKSRHKLRASAVFMVGQAGGVGLAATVRV